MIATSLIVATYNWPEALKLCLLSIMRQKVMPMEIIIADDGSAPKTRELIEQFQANSPVPLIHIWHEDLGFRKAIILNKAIKAASGDYIVQVDGDVILNQHFVEDHIDLAEKGTFVRGTRAHLNRNKIAAAYQSGKTNFNYFSRGIIHRFNSIRLPFLAFMFTKKQNNSNSVRGSNLAYWKSDYVLINGYNNDLQGWGHEDEELAARFINNNIRKKAVKFKAVQFHLQHELSSREQESLHSNAVKVTMKQQLKTCANGLAQV